MLRQLDLDHLVFLDIETVSAAHHFDDLDADWQALWSDKSRWMRERDDLTLSQSYGRAGIYAEFGKIVCISVGYFTQSMGERRLRITSFFGEDEAALLQEFADLLNGHFAHGNYALCAHNGKEFDFPYIARRMLINGLRLPSQLDIAGKKPWEIAHLDTMELWKFGDFKNYTSLKLLAKVFGIPTPKDDIDGSDVGRVYWEDNDLDRIEQYCRKDVVTIAQLVLKYQGKELLEDEAVVMV